MTAATPRRVIRLAVLDALLYGAAWAFDYLGFRGQDMLDRVGEGILQYGVSEGYFEKSSDPHQFTGNVVKFFIENGYLSNASVKQDGNTLHIGMWDWKFIPLMRKLRDRNSYLLTCPVCIANNAITKSVGAISERISEDITPDGVFSMQVKIIPGSQHIEGSVIPSRPADLGSAHPKSDLNETVGTPAFEAVTYGLAYGFDYLGAQAQLLLDNVGKGMIEFTREESNLTLPNDLQEALNALAAFMSEGGLADNISVRVSDSEVQVDFRNSRYLPVLKRLLGEGRELVSCPFTLAARSVIKSMRKDIGEMNWDITDDIVRLTMTTRDVNEREFDEENVSALMEQA